MDNMKMYYLYDALTRMNWAIDELTTGPGELFSLHEARAVRREIAWKTGILLHIEENIS